MENARVLVDIADNYPDTHSDFKARTPCIKCQYCWPCICRQNHKYALERGRAPRERGRDGGRETEAEQRHEAAETARHRDTEIES